MAVVSEVAAQPEGTVVGASVTRVIGGVTLEVKIGKRREKVHYIGINTPEIHHPTRGPEPYREAAKTANAQLVAGKNVVLAYDSERRDRDGRLLAYVYAGNLFVNAELVRAGYAEVATVPPNVGHREEFVSLQREARLAKRGLWADPQAVQYHRPRPSGVYGDTRLQIYFHPDDGARNIVATDEFVYFESPQQAAAAGYKPSMDYLTFVKRERTLLSGGPVAGQHVSPTARNSPPSRARAGGPAGPVGRAETSSPYRWIDRQGTAHYSQFPPPGTPRETSNTQVPRP